MKKIRRHSFEIASSAFGLANSAYKRQERDHTQITASLENFAERKDTKTELTQLRLIRGGNSVRAQLWAPHRGDFARMKRCG